jgi:competence protein ComEC
LGWIPWAAGCWVAGLAAGLSDPKADIVLCAASVVVAACAAMTARRAWPAALACLAVFGLGLLYGQLREASDASRLPERGRMELSGVVATRPDIDGDRVRFILRTDDGERLAVTVRLAGREELALAASWRRGDKARLSGELDVPRGPRNFGQFDYAGYLAKRGIHRVFAVDGARAASVERPGRFGLEAGLGAIEHVRSLIGARIAELFPGRQAGFMQAMLIGLDEDIDQGLFTAFARLGLTHVIAISGLHVGVVIGGCLFLFRLFGVSRETSLAAAFCIVPLYVILSGAAPSVVRAGIMALLGLAALKRGKPKDALAFVSLSAVVMTAWNPAYIHDIGFQLSFLVTAGLVAGTPAAMRLLPAGWPKWLTGSLAVAVTAQLVSFPLTVFYFNRYSLLSGLANFILVPVFSLAVLPIGCLSLLASAASAAAGRWLAAPAGWLNDIGFAIIEAGADLDRFGTVWASPPVGAIMLYYGLLAGIRAGIVRWRSEERELFPAAARAGRRLFLLCACGLAVWFALAYRFGDWTTRSTVSFLDVGQGDAILIRTPQGRTILVDGGGTMRVHRPGEEWRIGRDPYEIGEDLLVPLLMKRGVRRIDLMIATHGDLDHVGGLAAVAQALPTERIVFNGRLSDTPAFARLMAVALERRIPLHAAGYGLSIEADRYTRLDFLHPETAETPVPERDQNRFSLAFLLTMHGSRLLFTGDMDAGAERETILRLRSAGAGTGGAGPGAAAEGVREPVDVMKIAHHGSRSSTTELWLNRWKPRLAVISVGERNVYGHPGREVLERLERRGIPVLRTDLHGEIRLLVRPDGIAFTTFLK